MIIIPIKWLFHWEYTLFSDKPIFLRFLGSITLLLGVGSSSVWSMAFSRMARCPPIRPSAAGTKRLGQRWYGDSGPWEFAHLKTWVWINTYENIIFSGMNIHFNPAILMWTTGVQGFDTLPFEHESTTLMLCKMKMREKWCTCDILWHRDVGPGPLGCFKHVHLTEMTYMLLRCLLLVAVSLGVAGGGGGLAVITFLIVRSWWFIFHELKWHTCLLVRCALFGHISW